ncbi:MAG: hypothetical protein JXR95_07270 [Deltaproteobacteria bacterium]|nr:hypothetical protein [Deltaproteobacteria bacterium]
MKKGISIIMFMLLSVPVKATGQGKTDYSDEIRIIDSSLKRVETVINTASKIVMGKKYNTVQRLLNGVYLLKNNRPQDAAALFMSLTNDPQVGGEATFHYSESMYLSGNYLVAADNYFRILTMKASMSLKSKAIKRLLEISMKVRGFKGIEKLISIIENMPEMKNSWEVRYALGKYNYFLADKEFHKSGEKRNETFVIQKLQLALKYFDLFKPFTDEKGKTKFPPLYSQAIYYSGATLVRLAKTGATSFIRDGKVVLLEQFTAFPSEMRELILFEAIKRFTLVSINKNVSDIVKKFPEKTIWFEPKTSVEKEVQTLAVMAIGRIFYELGQTGESVKWYRMVDPKSKYYEDSLYEMSWVYVREGEVMKAVQTLAIMEVRNKNSVFLPRAKILLGYLNVRGEKWLEANKSFNKTSLQYKRVYNKIQQLLKKDIDPEALFDQITKKKEAKDSSGKKKTSTKSIFKVEYDIPPEMVPIFHNDQNFMKAVIISDDIEVIGKDLSEAKSTLQIVKRRLQSTSRIGAFPLLSDMRKKTYELELRNMQLRKKILAEITGKISSQLTSSDMTRLSSLQKERLALNKKISDMPKSTDSLEKRLRAKRKLYDKMTASIDGLKLDLKLKQEQIEALYKYYLNLDKKKKAKLPDMVDKLRAEAEHVKLTIKMAEKIRSAVVDASLEVGVDDSDMKMEKNLRLKYRSIVEKEFQLIERSSLSLTGEVKNVIDNLGALMKTSLQIDSRMDAVNRKIDNIAVKKIDDIRTKVADEESKIKMYQERYGNYSKRSEYFSRVVSKDSIKNIADKFQAIVMEADIGIVDVSWTKRSLTRKKWSRLMDQNNKITRNLSSRFGEIMQPTFKIGKGELADPFEEKKAVSKKTSGNKKETGKNAKVGGSK